MRRRHKPTLDMRVGSFRSLVKRTFDEPDNLPVLVVGQETVLVGGSEDFASLRFQFGVCVVGPESDPQICPGLDPVARRLANLHICWYH